VRRKSEPAEAAQPQTPLYLDGVPLDPTQPAYPSGPDAPLLPGSDLAPESLESSHPEGLDGFGQLEESFSPDSFEGEPTDDGFPDTESCEDSSFEPERSEPATAPQVAKPKPRRAGGRSVAFFVSVLQGVCLLACLGGPIFLAGGFSSLPASAESALKSPVPPRVLEQVERLGQQGLQGLRHLMGAQAE
jgi:hypothetical protein